MERELMVETEFLFGFQPKDKRYDVVSSILETFKQTKPFRVHYPASSLIEVRMVLASRGKDVAERLNALTFIKVKAVSSGLREVELSSDDLILCEHLLTEHRTLTFFDCLHGAVALNNGLGMISNDHIYDEFGIRRLSFEGFLNLLKTSLSASSKHST